ncbi:MAG: HdeD family acid-resistance protein [Chloroflexota bacterium]|nr:HdeD family acid-resistance protein [Chloroflexota bacterium]
MRDVLARNWWTFALRGVFAIIFGLLAWFWPAEVLVALVYLFAAYSLIDGVTALYSIFTEGGSSRWPALLFEGVLGVGAAIIAILLPALTALSIVYVIAAWALILGVLRIVSAVRLREEIDNEWMLALSGAASIIFGVILFLNPGEGALALIWVFGIWAIVLGVALIVLGFRFRGGSPVTA